MFGLDPHIVEMIDFHRAGGLQPSEIHEALQRQGLDPEKTLEDYMGVTDSNGLTRNQVNPGDPAWTP